MDNSFETQFKWIILSQKDFNSLKRIEKIIIQKKGMVPESLKKVFGEKFLEIQGNIF